MNHGYNRRYIMNMIIHVVVVALALLLTAYIIPGITVNGFVVALIAAVVLGIINLIIRPILFILTLPVTILTLGLFAFVLNAMMLMLAAYFVDGFDIDGFIPALLASLVVAVAGAFSNMLTKGE